MNLFGNWAVGYCTGTVSALGDFISEPWLLPEREAFSEQKNSRAKCDNEV